MKQYYIYKIICLMDEWNGKFYIGKHYGNVNDAYTGSGKLIKEYFKEYGKVLDKTYVKEIIDYGDENNICDLERDYIRKGQQSELCLNMICHSGIGYFRQKHSDEAKQHISESLKGRPKSEEMKQKLRKPRPEEIRRKISEAKKGKHLSEEHRRKMSEAAKRRWARN